MEVLLLYLFFTSNILACLHVLIFTCKQEL